MTISTQSFISVNIGSAANDGTGDDLRTAFTKVNNNFANISGTGFNAANIAATNISKTGLEITNPNYVTVSSTTTYSLSSTQTDNILLVTTTGLTATLTLPSSPTNGQVMRISANAAVTLALSSGNVQPTFAGAITAGTTFRYVYNNTKLTWYRN